MLFGKRETKAENAIKNMHSCKTITMIPMSYLKNNDFICLVVLSNVIAKFHLLVGIRSETFKMFPVD